MATKIEWCDETWNPITGCTPVSDGCENCYAKVMAERFPVTHAGFDRSGDGIAIPFSTVRFRPWKMDIPLHWKKPRRVFVCSMGDVFHEKVDAEAQTQIWDVFHKCLRHTFMILTKRPQRMSDFISRDREQRGFILPNVWLGVSVENQRTANERIPVLLDIPAALRFVSVEPMLGSINFDVPWSIDPIIPGARRNALRLICDPSEINLPIVRNKIEWVICGAETGAKKRPCKQEWIDDVRAQCQQSGVPFFGKKDSQGKPIMPREWPKER